MNMNIPTFKAIINDENEGIFVISLVTMPATEVNWVAFNKNDVTQQQFAIVNSGEHILAGVVMIADTPIYRVTPDGREYYIVFTKDVIKEMAEKMLSDNTFNNIDIQHNGELLPTGMIKLTELFITDADRGITPNYVDVPDGSLMAKYKIYDETLWNEVKNGDLHGFSLEGVFSSIRIVNPVYEDTNLNLQHKMNKVKETLRKLLISLGNIETDKGVLNYEGDYFEVGSAVTLNDEPAADGDYVMDDNKIAVVKDGVVVDIKEPKKEDFEETTETVEEKTETVEETTKNDDKIDEIKSILDEHEKMINELKDELKKLNDVITELNESTVVESVEEKTVDFSSAKEFKNRAAEIASYLNN